MKKVFFVLAAAVVAVMVSSCGIVSNTTSNVNAVQTEVVLSQPNYSVVNSVSAEASQTYIFGIGGLSKAALEQNAVAQLAEKASLSGSQAIINVATHTSVKMITPIYVKRTVVARGTVVEFK